MRILVSSFFEGLSKQGIGFLKSLFSGQVLRKYFEKCCNKNSGFPFEVTWENFSSILWEFEFALIIFPLVVSIY